MIAQEAKLVYEVCTATAGNEFSPTNWCLGGWLDCRLGWPSLPISLPLLSLTLPSNYPLLSSVHTSLPIHLVVLEVVELFACALLINLMDAPFDACGIQAF